MPTPEAGRELNERIATEILDWIVAPSDERYWLAPDGRYWNRVDQSAGVRGWSPSTDIAAAWLVVEHLKGERYFWLGWHVRDGRFQWECRFAAPEQYAALADTAPLAICLAALKALEATNPDAARVQS